MSYLAGKSVLITAAGQGIGRAIAVAFARTGAVVHATNTTSAALASLQEMGAVTRQLDVLNDSAIKATAADIGAIDVLVNCAGYVHSGSHHTGRASEHDRAWLRRCRQRGVSRRQPQRRAKSFRLRRLGHTRVHLWMQDTLS
jgi:NAD(P)-dependent dehydrogenase (short-subunit alcohol dehydrogenase family)